MRPINVSLDAYTWELAKMKHNFSEWVRNELRTESKRSKELEVALDDAVYWKEEHDKMRAIVQELREVKE